jgi:hypothetical protein
MDKRLQKCLVNERSPTLVLCSLMSPPLPHMPRSPVILVQIFSLCPCRAICPGCFHTNLSKPLRPLTAPGNPQDEAGGPQQFSIQNTPAYMPTTLFHTWSWRVGTGTTSQMRPGDKSGQSQEAWVPAPTSCVTLGQPLYHSVLSA